jgi:hypothetical protein
MPQATERKHALKRIFNTMQLHSFRTFQPSAELKGTIPYSSEAMRQDLERVRDAWEDCQATRDRKAIYAYLSAADKCTRSKWSRVMRYAAVYKLDSEPLGQFIRRKGGINECAARFTRRLGRGALTARARPGSPQ